MKNLVSALFFAFVLVSVVSCEDTSEVTPSEPIVPGSVFCQIDQLAISPLSYKYSYDEGKRIVTTNIFEKAADGKSPDKQTYAYTYTYGTGKVDVFGQNLKEVGSASKLTRTFNLGDGLLISDVKPDGKKNAVYVYAGGKLSYTVTYTDKKDSIVVGYDQNGKNITSMKHHAWENSSFKFSSEDVITYDAKVNPLKNNLGTYGTGIDILLYFSENNIKKINNNEPEQLTYNKEGYPILSSDGVRGIDYFYTCDK